MAQSRFKLVFVGLGALLLVGCIKNSHDVKPPSPATPEPPSVNTFLADSVAPIAHVNSAQTDSVDLAGPAGPTERLTESSGGLSYQHLGPAIDEDGGIYIPSLEHMHKVVWDGTRLSTDPADGAWVAVVSQFRAIPGPGRTNYPHLGPRHTALPASSTALSACFGSCRIDNPG